MIYCSQLGLSEFKCSSHVHVGFLPTVQQHFFSVTCEMNEPFPVLNVTYNVKRVIKNLLINPFIGATCHSDKMIAMWQPCLGSVSRRAG